MNFDAIDPIEMLRERTRSGIQRACETGHPVLVSVSMAVAAPGDLLGLLECAQAEGLEHVYWESGTEPHHMVGVGSAWSITASGPSRFRDVRAGVEALVGNALPTAGKSAGGEGPLFFGAFAFSSEVDSGGPWRGFAPARVVLPRLLVIRRDRQATVTVSVVVEPRSDAEACCRALVDDLSWLKRAAAGASPTRDTAGRIETVISGSTPVPDEDEWRSTVSSTLAEIADGRFEKLVVARACSIRAEQDFDAATVVGRLRRAYPSCVQFCFGTPEGTFLGATPEPLVRLTGRTVATVAIAGSAARGDSPEADRRLARALLASPKELHEHRVVVRSINDALEPLCEELHVASEPRVLELANVQHLETSISGRLDRERSVLDLVERLHPTPAVSGYPREVALREIARHERWDRGWYAGPVGWMDAAGNGEFAVAIRSALVRGREALLYAGAGIVAGSDPDQELAETRLKLEPLLSAVMGGEPQTVRGREPDLAASA